MLEEAGWRFRLPLGEVIRGERFGLPCPFSPQAVALADAEATRWAGADGQKP